MLKNDHGEPSQHRTREEVTRISVVQEFHNREITRLERSGWVANTAFRQRLGTIRLRPPARVAAECLDEDAGDGGGADARWARAEHAVAYLRKYFTPLRFSNDVDYGFLAISTSNRLDTRGTMDPNIRRGQQPDLTEDFVDPTLGEGISLAGFAGIGGATLTKNGQVMVAGVVGQYGISVGSHENVTAAVRLFEVDGVDIRTLMVRQTWGARLLQCPPGLVPNSDYTER